MSYAGGRPKVPLTESPLTLDKVFTGNLSQFGTLAKEHGIPKDTKTVIAFTNRAWTKLLKQIEKSQGRSELTRQEKAYIANYAFSPDAAPYAEVVLSGEDTQLDTFSGSPLALSCENEELLVRDVRQKAAKVIEVIRPASDEGEEPRHVYVVDMVLVPTAAQLVTMRRD